MQDIEVFDLVIILITLLLGLKGLFRGLIKEIFGIVGIVGAIFVASRISTEVGGLLAPILVIENQSTIKLIGFVVSLVAVWLIVYSAGIVVSKIFGAAGLGIVDRIFGLIFGMLKIFLIFSVIAYSLNQVGSFKKVIDEKFSNSIMMPHLLSVGSYIIKFDTTAMVNSIDKTIQNATDSSVSIQNGIEETKQSIEPALNDIKENVEQLDNLKENLDSTKEKLQDIRNKDE